MCGGVGGGVMHSTGVSSTSTQFASFCLWSKAGQEILDI